VTTADLFTQAFEHHRAGRTSRAELNYRQLLEREPLHDKALYLLGVIALEANRLDEALELLKRAVESAPFMPAYHTNLGVTLRRLGRNQEAVSALLIALSQKPDFAEAHFNLGLALIDLNDKTTAYFALEQAADLKPESFDIQYQFAHLLSSQLELARSIGHYHCALNLNPKSTTCLLELANVLRMLRRLRAAGAMARRAVEHAPDSAAAHAELGATLALGDGVDDAVEALLKATQLDPNLAEAHGNLGNVLGDVGRAAEAIDAYRRTLELRPDWSTLHSNILYVMPFAPNTTDENLLAEAQAWNRAYAEPLQASIVSYDNERTAERRLRVGYVSPHYFNHCQSFFTVPLFSHHDRQQFEISCYASVLVPDDMTQKLQTLADNWRDVLKLNNTELAELVRKDNIDILLDLTLHMENGRLPMFALRPAPVQICWLAYPGTTGVTGMDYRITDPFLDPPDSLQRPACSERSIVLPHSFWCMDPLENEIEPGPLPAYSNRFVTFGSLNHFRKIHDGVVDLWAQVLSVVPDSRMIILAPQGQARTRVLAIFEKWGIQANRIKFTSRLPRREYLRFYQQIDIVLDSFPYGGHTTSLDAFWMGVPAISLLGRTIVGRASLSIASNLQLKNLVASTPEEYVQIAKDLAANHAHLRELRSVIRTKMESSPLMDHARFARNMEDAYRTAWRIWCDRDDSDRAPLIISDR
jgi:protein O-GlcNAc transferase